jgi:glycosyltransferase involved in cell wall biosynthesis
MRIVYDHQIVGSQKVGGVSRYVYELAREMATTHGQDVTMLSPLFANSYLRDAPADLKIVGIPIRHIPRTGRIVRAINSIIVAPMMRRLSPDLVHETYYSPRRVAPDGAKVVLTVYDMIHERFKQQFPANDSTPREKSLAVARADHVICISERTRQDLVDTLRIDPAKTSVVHLGFALTNRGTGIATAAEPATRPFILYVGHRGGYKNFSGFVRAFAASSALRQTADIVCFGGGPFKRDETGMFQELGLKPDRIHHVSGDDVLLEGLYRRALALVYPSLYEGFGIPPLEAMGCDCPVACSGTGAIPEIVGDAAAMFDPNEIDSIRTTLERVVGDQAVRQNLILRGQQRIKNFSWAKCAQETFDIYRRVASRDV